LNNSTLKHFFRKNTLLFFLLYLTVNLVPARTYGQGIVNDSVYHLFARITGSSDHTPVQFAHIINRNTGHGNISDTLGFFNIRVHLADIIHISAIGYYGHSFRITDSLLVTSRIPNIELTSRSYPIDQVNVYLLGSYEQFKYKVLGLKLPEPKIKINPAFLKDIEMAADTLDSIEPISLGSPITAIYNLLSKEGKSMRRLAELQKQEALERKLYPKYNRNLVGHISGLEGIELNEFMIFCNFDPGFLLEATDYQIAVAILRRLEDWKRIRN
jgi:hypothetical protein